MYSRLNVSPSVQYGANVQQLDNDGLDAVYYAQTCGSKDAILLLELISGSVKCTPRMTPSPLLPP